MNCIFCKIIARELPASIEYETDTVIVIKDIYPKAPIHLLIIPKKHIADVQSFQDSDAAIAAEIIMTARYLSKNIPNASSFRLISNNGSSVGQVIFHSHFHFLAGKVLEHF